MTTGSNIYIVYSRKDEDAQNPVGWVFSFHRFFKLLLGRLIGQKLTIHLVKDEELDMESMYTNHTILIPIVSPELLNSGIFNEEIKRFQEKAINKSSNHIDWNTRVFKVLKNRIEGHHLLDFLSGSLGYKFYHIDPDTNNQIKYVDFTGPGSEKTFWMRLYDLAYDVSKVVAQIDQTQDEIIRITQNLNQFSIFLAFTGEDVQPLRDAVRRELLRNGVKVYPESAYPNDIDSVIKYVKKDLEKCHMTIHMIGSDPANITGTNASIIELQNRLAAEYFKNLDQMGGGGKSINLGRFIWISPDINDHHVKQKLYVEALKKDQEAIYNAEVLEVHIEELKTHINKQLERARLELDANTSKSDTKVIYFIYDKDEADKCIPVEKYLKKKGYEVIKNEFEGDPNQLRDLHRKNLKMCDATLIYYGYHNDKWMRSKLNDMMKSLGMGRDKPISPKGILVDKALQFQEKLDFGKDAMVLTSSGEFNPDAIEPFLARLTN
jgi:hypothetical protein